MQQRTVLLFIFISFAVTSQSVLAECFVPHRRTALGYKSQSWIRASSSQSYFLQQSKASALHSHIETIKVRNFGGIMNGNRENGQEDVTIQVGKGPNLVAVTGETGSGKSLLVAKVIEYIMGCKASPSIIPTNGDKYAAIKVVLKLGEPHLSATMNLMQNNGLDPTLVSDTIKNGEATLQLTRMIIENETKGKVKRQLKSICKVNGKLVTLKTLKVVVTPLIAIVDASAAGAALKDPKARMQIIDSGVKACTLSRAQEAKKEYRKCRQHREKIEKELANRVLPSSFSSELDDSNTEMIQHWEDEIDEFEARMNSFQDSILSSGGTASLLKDDEMDLDDGGENESMTGNDSFKDILNRFASSSWTSDATKDYEVISINDSYYSCLLDLRDGVKRLDDQMIAAHASCDVLSSLSTAESVAYALERSRNYLYDVANQDFNGDDTIAKATERSHELVNQLEDALNACNKFMADDPNGLVLTLETMRKSIFLSVEDIDLIIADWGALCRKHGINTFSLPSLQRSLQQELDGNIEAKLELPKARKAEDEALHEFIEACETVSEERTVLASKLSTSVTERIKSLGMEGSTFLVDLQTLHKCTDPAGFSENAILGLDAVSFLILHRQVADGNRALPLSGNTKNDERGGKLDVVGSSGEKARILLAIETDLPGSIGACCSKPTTDVLSYSQVAPVAVVYDEIDAHVGGRAAVALAKMLSDQTRESSNDGSSRTQIISITHNPAVAAVADHHLVIQKLPMGNSLDGRVEVLAKSVVGEGRREELARMAAGDLAGDEGLRFAEALLREASLHRTARTKK